MATGILTTSDFTGEFAITSDQFTQAKLQAYIDMNDERLLYDLLGVELADLLIADLVGGVPQTPIYQAFFNPFAEDNPKGNCLIFFPWGRSYYFEDWHCCNHNTYYHSKGIKYYLKTAIWFLYTRDYIGEPAVQGNVKRDSTNSTMVNYNSRFVATKYNDGVSTARAIQWYIKENESDYSEFNGSFIDFMTIVI